MGLCAAMRVLVTGSQGFVGKRLTPRLEAAGHGVLGFDQDTVDVTEFEAVATVVREFVPEAVVHLAAVAFVPDASRDPDLAQRVNVGGTRSVIRALESHAAQARLLLVGSGDQYPALEPGAPPLTESAALDPKGAYATSKAAAEELGHKAAERGLDVVRIRAFNHTGPGQAPLFVAPDFARQLARIEAGSQREPMRVGNLASVRDFLHVDDVIDAYIRLLDPEVPADVYNVASGRATRIGELLESLANLAGIQPQVEADQNRWRPADSRVGDPRRLEEATGWRARRPLDETLSELLAYWRAQVREQTP